MLVFGLGLCDEQLHPDPAGAGEEAEQPTNPVRGIPRFQPVGPVQQLGGARPADALVNQ